MKKDKNDVFTEYDSKNNAGKIIIIVLIILVIGFSSYLIYHNFDSIKSTIITQYNKKFNKEDTAAIDEVDKEYKIKIPEKGTKIYEINDVLGNVENAEIAEYVKSTREKLIYNDFEGAIFFASEKTNDGTQYYVIHVDKIIDSAGGIIPISKCVKDNDLNRCLKENQEYIVSEPDEAIIDVNYFRQQDFQDIIDDI